MIGYYVEQDIPEGAVSVTFRDIMLNSPEKRMELLRLFYSGYRNIFGEYYLLEQALGNNNWIKPIDKEDSVEVLKPLIIPGKGKAVRVYPWNMTLLRNTLVLHEKKRAEIKNNTLYIEGKPAQHCYFTKDYYWVGANNPINLSDSRLFGLVPKDHVIGKATVIWFSKEQGTGLFGGYRWNRMWKEVK